MRKRIGWWVLTLAILLGVTPAGRTQQGGYYEVPAPPIDFTGPLSHPRYEEGGFYTGFQWIMLKMNRPLRQQNVGVRGFIDVDGSITANGVPGTFVGSGEPALDVSQLNNPGSFQSAFRTFLGWRFESGIAVELSWLHSSTSRERASAGIIGPRFDVGDVLQNTFLFAPVVNFGVEFAGNARNLTAGNPGATFGIWNGASSMKIEYEHRIDIIQVSARMPYSEGYNYRHYGLFGPRIVGLYERFRWYTVDADEFGASTPQTVGVYSNIVSNRMYGIHFGTGHDWLFAKDPVLGGLAFNLEVEGGIYANIAKGRARYDLGDRSNFARNSQNQSTLVPGLEARTYLMWYPWEAIQVRVGYNAMVFFNTVGSRRPIDFNMGALNPTYNTNVTRTIHGIDFGVGFVF